MPLVSTALRNHLASSIILALGLFVSCGKKKSGGSPGGKTIEHDDTLSEFGQLIEERATLSCADSIDCPSAAVAIYSNHGTEYTYSGYHYQIHTCSGTLIDEQRIITNYHCVIDEHGFQIADCRNQLYIHTQDGETIGCESISAEPHLNHAAIGKSPDPIPRDMAIITLERTVSNPDSIEMPYITTRELDEGEALKTYVVNFESLRDTAYINRLDCQFMPHNQAYTLGSEQKTFAFLGNCGVEPGNSGSMVYDQLDQGVGLVFLKVQMSYIAKKLADSVDHLEPANNVFESVASSMKAGVAVTFTCLEDINFTTQKPWKSDDPRCISEVSQTQREGLFDQSLEGLDESILHKAQQELGSDVSHTFAFDTNFYTSFGSRYFVPKCFRAENFEAMYSSNLVESFNELAYKKYAYKIAPVFEFDEQDYRLVVKSSFSPTSYNNMAVKIDSTRLRGTPRGFDRGQSSLLTVYDCD